MPPFIKHLSDERQFELPLTQDLDYVGDFDVVINSSIQMPEDNSADPPLKKLSSKIDFVITVINPCLASVMQKFSIDDMQTSVKGEPKEQALKFPTDSVSLKLGDKSGFTYCGPRKFKFLSSGHENIVQYNLSDNSLTISTDNKDDIGEVEVTMEAFLENYPDVKESFTFKATVVKCKVISLKPVPTSDKTYQVMESPLIFSLEKFIQVPDCQEELAYDIELS